LLLFIPVLAYFLTGKGKNGVGRRRLFQAAIFGIAFGFVEAAVVVYLRAATGLLPGPQAKVVAAIPASLLRIECFREAATMVMLFGVAWLVGQRIKEKLVVFLWTFALWDLFYYVWLRVTIGWPASLLDVDVLFLIPVMWVAQVWFPMLVSGATAAVIWLRS